MCCCHKGKTTVLVLAGARIVYFTQSSFNAVVCCFEFTLWWDSQLNTSEMFWIDISRWMIRCGCRWIFFYLPWRTVHAFEPLPFFCSIVSIAVFFYSCQLPSCDLFSSHSLFIVFWERDITSESHGTPVHIATTIYTLSLLSVFNFSCHYYLLR